MKNTAVGGDGNSLRSDLRRMVEALRRWWWLLVLGPIIVGSLTYVVVSRQAPLYSATSTLGVDVAQSAMGSDIGRVQGSKELTETYRQLLASDPVLQAVIDQMGLADTVEDLRKRVTTSTLRDTQLLTVSVEDGDSERAAAIANGIADQFGAFLEQLAFDAVASARVVLEDRIGEIDGQIAEVNTQLDAVRSTGTTWPPADSTNGQTSLDALEASLASLELERDDLLTQIDQLNRAAAETSNQISLIVSAVPPLIPAEPLPVRSALIGVLAGLVLAGAAVVLLEFLEDPVTVPAQVANRASSGIRRRAMPLVPLARTVRPQEKRE